MFLLVIPTGSSLLHCCMDDFSKVNQTRIEVLSSHSSGHVEVRCLRGKKSISAIKNIALMLLLKMIYKKIILRALGCLNLTGGCYFSTRWDVCGDRFHALRSSGVSGVEMQIYERSLQALLSSAHRSSVLARLASLA